MNKLPMRIRWTKLGIENVGSSISTQGTYHYEINEYTTLKDWVIHPTVHFGEMYNHNICLICTIVDEDNHFYIPIEAIANAKKAKWFEIIEERQ